jgi:hypothetical protein
VQASKNTCHSRHIVAKRATLGGVWLLFLSQRIGKPTWLSIFWRISAGSDAHGVVLGVVDVGCMFVGRDAVQSECFCIMKKR